MTRRTFLLALLASCQPDAPATPSFQQDVMPILAANCVRCHGYPALGGAPPSMRLDVFSDIATDDTTTLLGAATLADLIAARVASETQPMPPRFPLDDFQIETLNNWASIATAGETALRGTPRPNNQPPQITVEQMGLPGAVVVLHSNIADSDGDLVAGELRTTIDPAPHSLDGSAVTLGNPRRGARPGGAGAIDASERIIGSVQSGITEVRWDAIGIAPGIYPLSAHLDDGAQIHIVTLGTITIGAP